MNLKRRNLKQFILSLLALSVLLGFSVSSVAIVPAAPEIEARSHLLIDLSSGQVLAEQLADEPVPPASLTKIMTSYVLSYELEAGNVKNDDLVQISENAWAKKFPGSSLMWIEVGTEVPIEDLHRGIVISSGNDATVAVAEHLAGTEAAFADIMNTHATELGMHGSHFVNSHGLPDPEHYMTARDLGTLAGALITRFPEAYKIYSEREYTYNNIRQSNRNSLLWRDSSVDGLKTGHTREAGYCLVASAERNGMRLVSVVLGAESTASRARESQKLLEYGFRYFETRKIYAAGETAATARVWEGDAEELSLGLAEEMHLTIPKGKHNDLQIVTDIPADLVAPLSKDEQYGTLKVVLGGDTLISAPLLALSDVPQAGLFSRLADKIERSIQRLIGGE